MSTVFIAFQSNEETRPVIEAIQIDNPNAQVLHDPAMVKINAQNHLVINRQTIEQQLGREYDLQELQINLITLSGHVDEDEESFTLSWNN